MKNQSKLFRILSLVVALTLVFSSVFVCATVQAGAASLSEQKASIDAKIAQKEAELQKLKEEKAEQTAIAQELQSQLADLTAKVSVIQYQQDDIDKNITSLNNDIASLSKQITETEESLVEMNESIDKTVELFCQRLRANYVSGSSSLLEVFLESGDIASLLNRIEMFKRVTDNDQKIVTKLQEDIETAENLKKELTEKKESSEIKKTELSAKKAELDTSIAEYDEIISEIEKKSDEVDKILYNYNTDIKNVQQEIASKEADQAAILAAIKKAEEEAKRPTSPSGGGSSSGGSSSGGSSTGTISKSGWMWPVPTSASYISSGYGYRSDPATGKTKLHSGMDIAAPLNSTIVATKSGTVVYVKYGNSGYGNHILLNHGDGTYSLYGHCNSLAVGSGQSVSQGQVIAYVGHSGYATGNHLHFEIRDGAGNKYNPASYVHK
ncbi:MAG: murein hydrolase activator EnvC family protein [Acutalibacteraceae bacterium]